MKSPIVAIRAWGRDRLKPFWSRQTDKRAGFETSNLFTGTKKGLTVRRIIDFYSLFYITSSMWSAKNIILPSSKNLLFYGWYCPVQNEMSSIWALLKKNFVVSLFFLFSFDDVEVSRGIFWCTSTFMASEKNLSTWLLTPVLSSWARTTKNPLHTFCTALTIV